MRPLADLIGLGVRNPVMANLAMVCLLAGGLLAAHGMVRETYPAFSLHYIGIEVVYPGASPEDVASSVAAPIEQAILGIAGIREFSSSSTEGGCSVFVALQTGASPDKVQKDIQDQIDRLTTLPAGAEEPVVSERILRNQVISIAICGQASDRTLRAMAEQVRDDLIADPDLSQVSLVGVPDREISIEVSEESLRRYGLSFEDLIAAVKRSSVDLPAGMLRTKDEEIILRTVGQRHTAADFEQLVVISAPDGTLIRLGQIAKVRDTVEQTVRRAWFNGRPAVMVSVYKTPAQDTSQIARKVRQYVQERQAELPEAITMSVWADGSRQLDARIDMLFEDGVAGMVLVLVMLGLCLNLRAAFWVAAGIPISYAGALIALALAGQTLNMISLLGVIIATGLVADDSILVAEIIQSRRRRGVPAEAAAIEGTAEVALPVLGSHTTTIAGLAPLLFVTGVMGKFIWALPVAVIASIVASGFEALAVLPSHMCHGRTPDSTARSTRTSRWADWRQSARDKLDSGVVWVTQRVYGPVLEAAVRNRLVTVSAAAACLLLTVGLVVSGRSAFVLFPSGESDLLRARVQFPEGTAPEVSAAAVRQLEQAARAINDDPTILARGDAPPVRQISSVVGEWPDFWTQTGSHLCEVSVELTPGETRRTLGATILDAWRRNVGTIHDAVAIEMVQQELAPTDKPLEIRLQGHDLDQLRRAADEVRDKLATYDGVYDIDDDLVPGKRELLVSLKPVARALGLTVADLAAQLRAGFFGGEAARVLDEGDEIKVQVRYPAEERRSLADVERIRIRTASGAEIPFSEAADAKLVRGYSAIWRQDGRPRVRVRANLDERRANAERILREIDARFLPELARRYRSENIDADFGYSFGGQRAQIHESLSSLRHGSILAVAVIYGLLAATMRSYVQPLILLLTIPLGLIGAVVGHHLMGYDLTMMSLFGMVSMAAVAVNDALVTLVQINRRVRSDRPLLQTVMEVGKERFLAIVLTTLTTTVGMGPLLLERSSQARSLIPMVISMVFGLTFATVLTVLFVPAMYLVLNDLRRLARWLRRGGAYPSPEVVEAETVEPADPAAAQAG